MTSVRESAPHDRRQSNLESPARSNLHSVWSRHLLARTSPRLVCIALYHKRKSSAEKAVRAVPAYDDRRDTPDVYRSPNMFTFGAEISLVILRLAHHSTRIPHADLAARAVPRRHAGCSTPIACNYLCQFHRHVQPLVFGSTAGCQFQHRR